MGNMNRAPRCCKVTPAAAYLSRMRLDWRWAFAGEAERNSYQPLGHSHTWRRMGILEADITNTVCSRRCLYRAAKHSGSLNRKPSPICVPCRALFHVRRSRTLSTLCLLLFFLYHHVSQACFLHQYNYNRLQPRRTRRDCMNELGPKIFTESVKRAPQIQGRLYRLKYRLLSQSVINLWGEHLQVTQRDFFSAYVAAQRRNARRLSGSNKDDESTHCW